MGQDYVYSVLKPIMVNNQQLTQKNDLSTALSAKNEVKL